MAMKKKALLISPRLATVGVDKVLERCKYGRSTGAVLTVRKRTFNLSLEAKAEPTKVLDQLLVEHLQFYGETKLVLRWAAMVLLRAELDSCSTTKGYTSPD